MNNIQVPIFKTRLNKISWKKIYDREYGVQYSELAVSLFLTQKNHFPNLSVDQIIIPGDGNNTSFFIDDVSWINLVEGLNKRYTSLSGLKEYEENFLSDGENYVETAKKISKLKLKDLSGKKLLEVFVNYKKMQEIYSVFAWSAFILNNYISDKALSILEPYIKKHKKENQKDLIIEALFKPEKRAAILELQYEVEKNNGKLSEKELDSLYEKYKWLSCLDIQNKEWSKEEFKEHIKSFTKSSNLGVPFTKIIEELKFIKKDLEYLLLAKRFVYIKDARDDYRREGVFYGRSLFKELARRMGILPEDTSYLLDIEIINFLNGKNKISRENINKRKEGFVMYIDADQKVVCLQGDQIPLALKLFNLLSEEEKTSDIIGRVASKGFARGKAVIVRGVKDLGKVKKGNILIALTTHPDFVPAMRRASAIVTDEGGITSHAAIISREFSIPCIVGTKVASKILKDGDLIEVDADKGVVKKI